MFKVTVGCISLLFCFFSFAFSNDIDSDIVLKAMSKELLRSYKKLEKNKISPLYHLAYEITDLKYYKLVGFLGSVEDEEERRNRFLDVDIRVGSHKLDNTHQFKGAELLGRKRTKARVFVPMEDDYLAIRTSIWRWTDYFFRQEQENYIKVKTNKAVTSTEEDSSNDFSENEKVYNFYEKAELPKINKKLWRKRVKKYSAKFLKHPFIHASGANFSVETENRYIVNSEGTKIRTAQTYIRLKYHLITRTEDGMDLYRLKTYDGETMVDMPSDSQVISDIEKSILELSAIKKADASKPYSGPAILRNKASATFFHEIFGHRIEGHRQKSEISGQTFAGEVGKKIVSSIISISDDPTLRRFNGIFLRGHYKFDNEGVKAQKVLLVENGILKNFLMDRSPIKGFPNSNGHGRRTTGNSVVARMGNTIVTAKNPVPYTELKQMLIDEIKRQGKPYGLIFEDISGGFTFTHRFMPQSFKVQPLLVYKVYPDGREDEIVRGVDIVGTPLTVFNKIIAAADDPEIFNGYCTAESGVLKVSAVSPSILVSEIEVEKVTKSLEKPPILKTPYHSYSGIYEKN